MGAETHDRLRWPDVAKGACILLVVLHHVVVKSPDLPPGPAIGLVGDVWHELTHGLKPVRMPLFFVLSGVFAAGAVRRPWAASWRRVATGYYLYVVWLLVLTVALALAREVPANRVNGLADLAGQLLWAASSAWFLYALAVYLVVARATRGLPPALVVGAAAGLSVAASGLGIGEANRLAVLVHLVYFLAGACYPHVVRQVAAVRWSSSMPVMAGLCALYVATAAVALSSAVPWSAGAFVASLLGVPLGILLAVRVADAPLGAALAWVGRRSLRVYVLHIPVLVALLQLPPIGATGQVGLAVAIAHPVAVTALVVACCLGAYQVLQLLGARWLFALPSAVDQRLAALGAPAASGQPARARRPRLPGDHRPGMVT